MRRAALGLLSLAAVTALLGFAGPARASAPLARDLSGLCIGLFVAALIGARLRGRSLP